MTFDAFTQDISYCPVIYTVHLLRVSDLVEVTWNREDNPLVSVPAYDAVADSDFSSNSKSSEYLTISRPANGQAGTITISNLQPLDDFIGSYYLVLRAHHQDVTEVKQLSHTGYDCDITVTYDTSSSITYYLGTGPITIDL